MLNLIGDLQELNINSQFRDNYDLETYQNKLYLAGISSGNDPEYCQLNILVYDNLQSKWQNIYQQKIQGELDSQKYQVKLLKLNNLYKKDNLFVILANNYQNLIFRLEDKNIFTEVTTTQSHLKAFIKNLYNNSIKGIYLMEKNKINHQLKPQIKYRQDWSQEKAKLINIPNSLINDEDKISQISLYNNHIYLGINNQKLGFYIHKLAIDEAIENKENWQLVIQKGAYQYSLNQKIFAMTIFQDSLYLACGLDLEEQNLDQSKLYKNGFELIRIYPDDDWDLIAGKPKFSPQGLKVPLSVLDSGFGDPENIIVYSLMAHNNQLCLWTKNIDNLQVWHSEDGEDWQQEIIDFALNYYAEVKVIKTLSCDWGLVVTLELINLDKTKNTHVFLYNF